MKLAVLTMSAFLFVGVQLGQAEKLIRLADKIRVAPAADTPFSGSIVVPHNHTQPHGMPGPVKLVKPTFPIPNGKFGIELKDGTKMIGVPKSTSVTLRTTFGNATIPRKQIAKIESAKGVTRVYLNNGDRVSGKWVTTVIQFETQFGMLKVPVTSLVWLRTSSVGVSVAGTDPNSAKPVQRSRPRPPSGLPAAGSGGLKIIDSPRVTPRFTRPR